MNKFVVAIFLVLSVSLAGLVFSYMLSEQGMEFAFGVVETFDNKTRLNVDSKRTETVEMICTVRYMLTKDYEQNDVMVVPVGSVCVPLTTSKYVTDYYVVVENEQGIAYRFRMDELDWKMLKTGDTLTVQEIQEYRTNGRPYAPKYTADGQPVDKVAIVETKDNELSEDIAVSSVEES